MPEPSIEGIMSRLRAWQTDPGVHPLTCANDSRGHRILEPVQEGDRVVLICLDCNYRQTRLPVGVLRG